MLSPVTGSLVSGKYKPFPSLKSVILPRTYTTDKNAAYANEQSLSILRTVSSSVLSLFTK